MRCAMILLGAFCLASCGNGLDALKLGQIRLADATATLPVPEGPRIEISADGVAQPVPAGAKIVQIAADREAPYMAVRDLVKAVHRSGARPVLLVSNHGELAALPPLDDAASASVLLEVEKGGKVCVAPPEAEERLCQLPAYTGKVDRASVRDLIFEAVKGYQITAVHVRPAITLTWVEVVRGIDGARTCCRNRTISVSVEDLPAR